MPQTVDEDMLNMPSFISEWIINLKALSQELCEKNTSFIFLLNHLANVNPFLRDSLRLWIHQSN